LDAQPPAEGGAKKRTRNTNSLSKKDSLKPHGGETAKKTPSSKFKIRPISTHVQDVDQEEKHVTTEEDDSLNI
jgi:hypothetical protein